MTLGMFLGAWTDIWEMVIKCKFRGTEEQKAKHTAEFPKDVERFVNGLNPMVPESGWIHGRDIPSVADIAVFCIATFSMQVMNFDWTPWSKFTRLVEAVGKVPGATL